MKGFTLWFTGLPRSGKTTLSQEVEAILLERGLDVETIDGKLARQIISRGLGISKDDQNEHVRRIAFICKLLSRNKIIAIAAATSPLVQTREETRASISNFVEVFCKCPIEICISRDKTDLYAKAKSGELKGVVGIDAPYEPPEKPEIIVETDKETVEESVKKIIYSLELLGYILKMEGISDYSPEEEEIIKKRLKDLGYI